MSGANAFQRLTAYDCRCSESLRAITGAGFLKGRPNLDGGTWIDTNVTLRENHERRIPFITFGHLADVGLTNTDWFLANIAG